MHIYIYIYIYIYIHIYVYVHVHVSIYISIYMHICIQQTRARSGFLGQAPLRTHLSTSRARADASERGARAARDVVGGESELQASI